LLFIGWTLISCSKQDLEAEIPAYIQINNFTLTISPGEGTDSHKITDAWVYINDELLGVFELPAKVPVLKEGNVELSVYPGIKENGIKERRERYLFYNAHVEQVDLVKNEIIEITPTTTYSSNTTFYWMEDFESASLPFFYNVISDTTMHKTNTDVFEGNYSGRVYMLPAMDFFECNTPGFASLPRFGTPVFMEIDFKTNQPVLVGIYADTEQIGLFYMNTTSDWNKIYFNFTEPIVTRPGAAEYRIFFGFENDVEYPELIIDNIKLLHL